MSLDESGAGRNEEDGATSASDLVLELNFVPAWARRPPSVNHYASGEDRGYGGDGGRRDRPPREGRGGSRPPRGRRDEGGPRRRDAGPSRDRDDRRSGGRLREGSEVDRREMAAPPPVSIAFFPERRQLAALARQIHTSRKAYPLLEVASLVMSKPEYYQVKIESPKGQGGVDIVQCKVCGTVALDESTIIVHAFREHMADFFEVKEEESPEPAGQFPCVARCGLSGVLLGPPNHHSYAEKVREVHAARYPAMPIEEYRRRIETVRDEALVAQWKSENKVRKTYLPKGRDGAEQMDRTRAETYFRENAAPGVIAVSRRVVLPAVVAQGIEDSALRREVGQAWQRETRFPRSVLFALRAALKHMRLHVFRAGKGISFVTHTQPSALDPDRAVESIGGVLRYLSENPGSTRSKLVEALKPGEPEDSPAASEILSPLTWLIERGHIIEFFNGTLSVPLGGVRPAQPSNAS